jgi:hypothetical protein
LDIVFLPVKAACGRERGMIALMYVARLRMQWQSSAYCCASLRVYPEDRLTPTRLRAGASIECQFPRRVRAATLVHGLSGSPHINAKPQSVENAAQLEAHGQTRRSPALVIVLHLTHA